jgi:hypothetical protein
MNTIIYKIVTFIILFLSFYLLGCNNNSPVKISNIEGNEVVECNIDKISDVNNLKLSKITESYEMVPLKDDPALEPEDHNIKKIRVSRNYLVVMPVHRPALLYSRNGEFIKRLGGEGKQKYFQALDARIDSKEEKVYIQISGYNQLLVFGLKDQTFNRLTWAIEKTMNYMLLDPNTLFGITNKENNRYWGYLQPVIGPRADLIPARYQNLLHPWFPVKNKLLYVREKIILTPYKRNDTSYYFNPETKTYTPFLVCYSEKHSNNPRQVLQNIARYGPVKKKVFEKKPFHYKYLKLAANNYYIYLLNQNVHKKSQFIVINQNTHHAFYLKWLINDFIGNEKIDPMGSRNFRLEEINGYLTFQYTTQEFKAMNKNIPEGNSSHTSIKPWLLENKNLGTNIFRVILICNLK